jgi:two-component system OmpR family response regulator
VDGQLAHFTARREKRTTQQRNNHLAAGSYKPRPTLPSTRVVPAATATAPRVLIVEDDTSTRDALFVALTVAGFEVRALSSGEELASIVAEFHPDIVGLDVWLQEGPDGFELSAEVLRTADVPVIFLTAADAVEYRLHGFELGADDYIVKPFTMAEVIARMHVILRRSGRMSTPTLHVGDLSIDQRNQVAYRGGQRIDLTSTELEVLTVLARAPWQVFSKAQLLSMVWGLDTHRENLVEVYVSSVRRKLEGFGPRMIFTERSRGYVLRP